MLEIAGDAGLTLGSFRFAVMVAASACLARLDYQANPMVYSPGHYRFAHLLRVGIPMNLLAGAVAIAIPLNQRQLAA